MTSTFLIPAIMLGILITAPTGLAILICSRGNAADRHEIARLTRQVETLEQQRRTDIQWITAVYADHENEIASLKENHNAELQRMSYALNGEFTRGIEWERKRPEREASAARWAAKMDAEHKALAEAWR